MSAPEAGTRVSPDPRDRVIDRLPASGLSPPHAAPFDGTESGVFERFAPGISWLPRWWRKHLTPHMVIGALVIVFSAGTFWANFRTSGAIADARREVQAHTQALDDFKAETNVKLDGIAAHNSKVDVLERAEGDLEQRVDRLEDAYDTAQREAGTPLSKRPRKHY